MAEPDREPAERRGLRQNTGVGLALVAACALIWVQQIHLQPPDEYMWAVNADVHAYHFPSAVFLHDALRSGSWPSWNPNQMAGQPFAALHVVSALYPPHVATFAALSPERALDVTTVLHLALAGFLTWLLTGRLGLSTPARLLATAAYMLCPPFVRSIYQVPYLYTQAWLPGLLWAVHGLLSERRVRWAIAFGATLALAFLGGHAQGFLYSVQLAAAFGVVGLFVIVERGARLRAVALACLGGLLALALVAPQLLSTLELVGQAERGMAGITLEDAAGGATWRANLIAGVLGGLGGDARAETLIWPLLGLPLVVLGALARRQRAWFFFFGSAVVLSGLFMLGAATPVFRIAFELPLGNLFRAPYRMDFVHHFAVAMAFGIGAEGLGGALRRVAPARVVTGVLVVFLVAAGADLVRRFDLRWSHPSSASRGGAAWLADVVGRADPAQARIFVDQQGFVKQQDLPVKSGSIAGVAVVPDYEPTMPSAYATFFAIEGDLWHGALSLTRETASASASRQSALSPSELVALLDLMSVRWYTTAMTSPHRAARIALARAVRGRPVQDDRLLLERSRAVPRAYAVSCVTAAADLESMRARLVSPGFRPRHEAVLVGEAGPELAAALGRCKGDDPGHDIRLASYRAMEVVVDAKCGAPCLLVLTDFDYPGWEAFVDGEASQIVRVHGLFRGVRLGPGAHRVVFRFRSLPLRWGGAIAGLAGISVGVIVFAGLRAGRRDPASDWL